MPNVPHPFKCFTDRLAYDGKLPAWDHFLDKKKSEGVALGPASNEGRVEFGYLGAAEEKRLWLERQAIAEQEDDPDLDRTRYKRIWDKLPSKAAASEEMEWIAAHDLMDERMNQDPDDESTTVVLSRHIESAPSKAAVIALKQWLADPREFQKARLSETRKHTDGGKEELRVEQDPGCLEIERMLKEIQIG